LLSTLKPLDTIGKGNYSANAAALTLAPIKGRLCVARRGGDNNYSPKKGTPDLGWQEKGSAQIASFGDEIAAMILKSGE
jgi:hypothetical protein